MNNEQKIIELLAEIRDLLKPKLTKTNKSSQRFTPPTRDDVGKYCLEKNYCVDPDKFIDHYKANGWMRGKTKIKDWKACVRTWEKRNGSERQGQNTGFDNRSRAQKVSDKLDEIARKDIEQNGHTTDLGGGSV